MKSSQVVLVTGALAGIRRATAVAFARSGAKVIASGRRPDAGATLACELRKLGSASEFTFADVRHEAGVRELADCSVSRFGRLAVAVNNAGTEGAPGPITGLTPESYAAVFDTNVLAVLLCMKHELRVMTAQKSGCITNLSSTFGRVGGANVSPYVANKRAVEGLTKSAALERAPFGFRVNVVAPGPVETESVSRVRRGSKAGLPRRFRSGAWAGPKRSPTRSSSSRHLRPRSSLVPPFA